MRRCLKALVLCMVCVSLSCGCSKSDKAMPLTKGDVTAYLQKVEAAVKSISTKDAAEAKASEEKRKQAMYKCFIAPMEGMGYSYDKTIGELAKKVLAKNLATTDSDTTIMLSNMLSLANNLRDTEYKYQFISLETKKLLDQVSLIFPR